MTAVVARMTYAIPGTEPDTVAHSGRLSDLLVDVFDRWKTGSAEHAHVTFGLGERIPAEIVESVFNAMKIVEART